MSNQKQNKLINVFPIGPKMHIFDKLRLFLNTETGIFRIKHNEIIVAETYGIDT